MNTNTSRYTRPAVALHWIMALGLMGAAAVGWWASDLPISPQRLRWLSNHKAFGLTLLGLAALRLAWRWGHPPPPLSGSPTVLRITHGVHGLLYVLMLAVPLLGWAYSNAAGFPAAWFGGIVMPTLLAKDPALADLLKGLHGLAAWSLVGLFVLHIAAALKHQFIDRDGLLERMRWH